MSGQIALRTIAVAAPNDATGVTLAHLASALHLYPALVRRGVQRLIDLGCIIVTAELPVPRYARTDLPVPDEFIDDGKVVPRDPNASRDTIDNRNASKFQSIISLAKRDGSEKTVALADVQAAHNDIEQAARLLAGHAFRACEAEGKKDALLIAGLLASQAEAFVRAAAKLRVAAKKVRDAAQRVPAATKQAATEEASA